MKKHRPTRRPESLDGVGQSGHLGRVPLAKRERPPLLVRRRAVLRCAAEHLGILGGRRNTGHRREGCRNGARVVVRRGAGERLGKHAEEVVDVRLARRLVERDGDLQCGRQTQDSTGVVIS